MSSPSNKLTTNAHEEDQPLSIASTPLPTQENGIHQKPQEIIETVKAKYGEETVPVTNNGTLISQIQNDTGIALDGLEQENQAKHADETITQESFIESNKKCMEAKNTTPDLKKTALLPNVEKKKDEILYLNN